MTEIAPGSSDSLMDYGICQTKLEEFVIEPSVKCSQYTHVIRKSLSKKQCVETSFMDSTKRLSVESMRFRALM